MTTSVTPTKKSRQFHENRVYRLGQSSQKLSLVVDVRIQRIQGHTALDLEGDWYSIFCASGAGSGAAGRLARKVPFVVVFVFPPISPPSCPLLSPVLLRFLSFTPLFFRLLVAGLLPTFIRGQTEGNERRMLQKANKLLGRKGFQAKLSPPSPLVEVEGLFISYCSSFYKNLTKFLLVTLRQ